MGYGDDYIDKIIDIINKYTDSRSRRKEILNNIVNNGVFDEFE